MRAGLGTPVLIWVVQSATCPPYQRLWVVGGLLDPRADGAQAGLPIHREVQPNSPAGPMASVRGWSNAVHRYSSFRILVRSSTVLAGGWLSTHRSSITSRYRSTSARLSR